MILALKCSHISGISAKFCGQGRSIVSSSYSEATSKLDNFILVNKANFNVKCSTNSNTIKLN